MGIVGFILIVSGVVAIVEKSLRLGIALIILGLVTYVGFVFIEKKLKIL